MDAARSAIRCHAKEVTIIYRRRQVDMTALPSEIPGFHRRRCRTAYLKCTCKNRGRRGLANVRALWHSPR